MPTKKMYAPTLNKEELIRNGLVPAMDTNRINTEMKFEFPKNAAIKSDLAVLNIVAAVAQQGWKRPLYFDANLRQGDYAGLGDYMRMEGDVYRLMPYKYQDSIKINSQLLGTVDADKSYDLFTKTYIWGGAERNDVYFDEPNRHELVTYRMDAGFIANALIANGEKDKAVALIDKVVGNITEHSYSYDFTGYYLASGYYRAGAIKKGSDLAMKTVQNCRDNINYVVSSLSEDGKMAMAGDLRQQWEIMGALANVAHIAGDKPTEDRITDIMKGFQKDLAPILNAKMGGGNEGGE